MTSRERAAALLRREVPDRMGIFEHFWPETLPSWVEQGYPEGQMPADFFGFDMEDRGDWLNTAPFRTEPEVLEETEAWRVTKDGWGAVLKRWKSKSGAPQHLSFAVTDPQAWTAYREPLLALDRERLKTEGCGKPSRPPAPRRSWRCPAT